MEFTKRNGDSLSLSTLADIFVTSKEYNVSPNTFKQQCIGKSKNFVAFIREVEFLSPARVTIMSERRKLPPPGYHGGHHGQTGENVLLRGGYEEVRLAGKELLDVEAGDVLSMRTPGGGGWGAPEEEE